MLLEDLHVALKVAEYQSITEAAQSLDIQTATASAALKRVEKFLGVELFIRTTRKIRLSGAGEKYLPQCYQALKMLDSAKEDLKQDSDKINGEVRISLTSDLGRNFIIPWIDEFLEQHPGISLKAHLSDSNLDFYRNSIDLALRFGSPNDKQIYGFKICNVPRVLCASKEYIQTKGIPQSLQDLTNHNALLYQIGNIAHDVWEFKQNGRLVKIKIKGNRSSNDADIVRRWCLAGYGLAFKSAIDMSNDLLSGKVINIMPETPPASTELWLVSPSRQHITPAVRLLRDMFQQKCNEILNELVHKKVISQSVLNN